MRLDEYGILLRSLVDEPWRSDAACYGMDPSIFLPDDETGDYDLLDLAIAKATCDKCPVRVACRDSRKRGDEGVWGGETLEEQKRRKRQARDVEESCCSEDGCEERGDSCTED